MPSFKRIFHTVAALTGVGTAVATFAHEIRPGWALPAAVLTLLANVGTILRGARRAAPEYFGDVDPTPPPPSRPPSQTRR